MQLFGLKTNDYNIYILIVPPKIEQQEYGKAFVYPKRAEMTTMSRSPRQPAHFIKLKGSILLLGK
jgi:hypothetical protein